MRRLKMNSIQIGVDHLLVELSVGSALSAFFCGLILTIWLRIRKFGPPGAWPTAMGILLDREITVGQDEIGRWYRPVVRYCYDVAGHRFEGSHIGWSEQQYRSYTGARSKLDCFAPGQRVNVYYDPKMPSIAVLHKGREIALRAELVIASTAVIYVLLIACPLFFAN